MAAKQHCLPCAFPALDCHSPSTCQAARHTPAAAKEKKTGNRCFQALPHCHPAPGPALLRSDPAPPPPLQALTASMPQDPALLSELAAISQDLAAAALGPLPQLVPMTQVILRPAAAAAPQLPGRHTPGWPATWCHGRG